jgi:hypothetical protein
VTNPSELPPPMAKDPSFSFPPPDPNNPGFTNVAEVIALDGQLKMGTVQGFTVRCDEGARVGGSDTAPSPLGYFTVAMGF